MALPIAFGAPYHNRPNGGASEVRSKLRLSLRGRNFVKMTTTLRLHQAATGWDSVPAQDRPWRGPGRGKGAILRVATLVASIRLLQQFYL